MTSPRPLTPAPNSTPTASRPGARRHRQADRAATAASQRSAWAEGLGQALTVLACGAAALASAVLAAPLALGGSVEPATVAVVVLLQLALVEPYAAITTAVRQYPALRAVLRRISEAGVLDADGPATGGNRAAAGPDSGAGAWRTAGGRPGVELEALTPPGRRRAQSSPGSAPRRSPAAGSR